VIHGDISGVRPILLYSYCVPRSLKRIQNNILIKISEDASIQVQLCDFGLTVVGNDTSGRVATTLDPRSTGDWMAPERQTGRRLDTPVDVYAFGCVCYAVSSTYSAPEVRADAIYQMCTGRPPQPSIAKKIANGDRSAYPPEDGSGVPVCRGVSDEEFWEMASRCWHISPQRRPSMATILAYLGEVFMADSEAKIPGTQPRTLLCITIASAVRRFPLVCRVMRL
jgi:serine/threonine protein kinase